MATVKAIIRKKSGKAIVNDKGQTLVYIQYGHDSKVTLFSTGIKILPKQWSESKMKIDSTKDLLKNKGNEELIKLKEKEDNYSNANIEAFKSKITSIVRKLQHKDAPPTVALVKEAFEIEYNPKTEKLESLFDLIDAFIEERKATMSHGTIKQYGSIKSNLLAYQEKKKEKITLEKINLSFYDKFVQYLLEEHQLPDGSTGMSNNTVGNQVKNLKAILKYLKKRGHSVYENLEDFKVLKEKGQIIYHSQEELEVLHHLEIPSDSILKEKYAELWKDMYKRPFPGKASLEMAKDIHILECQTSLRVSDRKRLGKEHIYNNVIKMPAHKNKNRVTIPLTPKAMAILQKYDYEIPDITEQRMNEYVKAICLIAGFDYLIETTEYKGGRKIYTKIPKWQTITNHIAVKTFISHCGEKNISAKVVSEITGKSVKIIHEHYYGTNEKVIEMEMQRAFGTPEPLLKIS
ncbi:MAG TPA: site-specific integrase [Cytophagaceae bacterium]|jgi:integrase